MSQAILRKIGAMKSLQRSTPFDGEADAAILAIRRLESRMPPAPSVQRVGLLGTWQRTAWLLLLSGMKWSKRERDFLESMRCKRSSPSERQDAWLKDLDSKAKANRPEGGWQ